MMRPPLTVSAMGAELERLNHVFTKYGADDLRAKAQAYFDALRELDLEQVQGAVALAIRNEKRFPPPAVLLEHARTWRQANRPQLLEPRRQADPTDPDAPVCAVCGARPRKAWLKGRVWRAGKITDETFTHERFIAPCDASRHAGSGFVPYPPNFLGWAD